MQYDCYAFRKEQLGDPLNELEQARQQRDKNARNQAIEQAAKQAIQLEPHLSYLWYEAQGSELKNPIRDTWQKHLTVSSIPDDFHFTPKLSALNYLPSLSFMLRVPFTLKKPYLSKDDRTFHLLDNPVRKDKVFQTPMVASTSWKGALRAALWQLGHQKDDETIIRLFGNAREDEKGQAGHLYFYPTFFDNIDKTKQLEVINPHDRKTGIGKKPILIECVPADATGEFILLCVPFGSVKLDEVAADLQRVAEGVEKTLTVYGFGAKTSSGFGIAELNGTGELAIRADLPDLKQPEPEVQLPEPELPHYLIAPAQLHPDFQNANGNLKTEEEYLKGKSGKKEKQLYDKAKKWWERGGHQLAQTAASEPAVEPEPPPPKPSVTEVSFVNWSELCDRAKRMAEQLRNRGEI